MTLSLRTSKVWLVVSVGSFMPNVKVQLRYHADIVEESMYQRLAGMYADVVNMLVGGEEIGVEVKEHKALAS